MTGGFKIRAAEAADLDAIMELEDAAFGPSAWSREQMAEELGSRWGTYLVVEAPDRSLLGYAGLRAVGVEGDVQTICVSADARGHGLGRSLFERVEREARDRGVGELFLEVREDNPVARGLYASSGFVEIGVRPRYYQPEDVDAIVMKKELR